MLYFPWKCKNMFLYIFLGFNNWFIKALRIWLICGLLILIMIYYDVYVFYKKKYKKIFLCVAYGQYPNMFWTFFLYKKTNIWSFEQVFSHGFLKQNKKLFLLHFWILQHVCKTPKGIGQYFKKIQKSYFEGNSFIIHH